MGDAFSNAERGITLATRKPNSPKMDHRIQINNRVEASALVTCSKTLKVLGKAAATADVGLRLAKVVKVGLNDEDWMREGVRQLTGFGTGAAFGTLAGRTAITGATYLAAASGLTFAGPIGWLVLGGIVVIGLAAGFAVGSVMDNAGQGISGLIMEGR